MQHGSNAIRRNLIGVEVTHEINFNLDMNSFFNDFLAKHGATAAQCVVVLHTVSATDSLIISVDPDAARVYASFHEMPSTQRQRFRPGIRYLFVFLGTRDRHFILNDVYAVEGPTDPVITQFTRQAYKTYFPHNPLPADRNHAGYSLSALPEGANHRGKLIVKKPQSYSQGYVFYAEAPKCHEMLVTAQTVDPAPEGGPMDLVIQMPLTLIDRGLAHGHFTDPAFTAPGVYMLRYTPTGDTYVGSASGGGGLARRWRDYADTVHGGNMELVALVGEGATAADFSVTALEVTADGASALIAEQMWKRRLVPTLNKN